VPTAFECQAVIRRDPDEQINSGSSGEESAMSWQGKAKISILFFAGG